MRTQYALAAALLAPARAHGAPPATSAIPVATSYRSYAAASAAAMRSEAHHDRTIALGRPMPLIATGAKRSHEDSLGYATAFATWAQTTLRVPLGWYAFDSKADIERSILLSPDKSVRIVARHPVGDVEFQRQRDAFARLKRGAVAQVRARLAAQKLRPGRLELLELPGGAFAVRASKVTDAAGKKMSYIERFSQRATPAEIAAWWAKHDAGKPLGSLRQPIALSLLASEKSFAKYLGLLGLVSRDEGVNWTREESLSLGEFRAQAKDAARFEAMATEAIALLQKDDVAGFFKRFPDAFEGGKRAEAEAYLRQAVLPTLKALPAKPMRESVTVARDRDPVEPFYQVTLMREFQVGEAYPAYTVVMKRAGGHIKLDSIATTDPMP